MAAYILFGTAVFSTAQRRDKVADRATRAAQQHGFIPTSRVPGYQPGVIPFTFTAEETSDGLTAGQQYPAVTIAYQHTDQQTVADADLLIQDEMTSQGWLYGSFGTWTDISG